MKRFLATALTVVMLLGVVSMAQAVEVKWKGVYDVMVWWADNLNFQDADQDGQSEDDFGARQRVRLIMDFVANENLKGQLYLESGETVWGDPTTVGRGSGGAIGADGVSIEVRRAFIDFKIPNTALKFTVGIQGVALPDAGLGNPVLSGADSDMGAIVASYKFNDQFSLVALWGRPYDLAGDVVGNSPANDEIDVLALSVPMKFEGVKFNPYFLYAFVGNDALAGATGSRRFAIGSLNTPTEPASAWWGGFAFELSMFDPLWFGMDFAYGSFSGEDDDEDRSGWTLQAELDYKLDFMTVGLAAWYATGDDDDVSNGSETMPTIDGRFMGSSMGFFGSSTLTCDRNVSWTNMGSWGVGLLLKDISFIEDLSHTVRIIYLKGTNDGDTAPGNWVAANSARYGVALSDKDSAWEINFDSTYNIYKELALIVEAGYISPNLDEDVWGTDETSDAWKLAFGLQYKF